MKVYETYDRHQRHIRQHSLFGSYQRGSEETLPFDEGGLHHFAI